MRILSLLTSAVVPAVASAASAEQCYGHVPMSSVSNYLGAALDYPTAERICCNNHRFAEYRGYLEAPEVDLFGRLDPNVETVFYDSVCGIPLFIAPRGRSFEEFKKESIKHGWPSFRPEEMVSENVIIHDDGRMESKCLTHLGHNLPEGGMDRYCIDLVCVAGRPLSPGDDRASIIETIADAVLDQKELNITAYVSSAEANSGKHGKGARFIVTVVGATFAAIFTVAVIASYVWRARSQKEFVEDDRGTSGTASVDDAVIN